MNREYSERSLFVKRELEAASLRLVVYGARIVSLNLIELIMRNNACLR
jgi:hypothetical protein